MKILTLLSALILLVSCQEKVEEPTAVLTQNVYVPPTFQLDGVAGSFFDLGEFLNNQDPVVYTVTVTNNSDYALTNMTVDFADPNVTKYDYVPDEEGESSYPGTGGTCTFSLAAGASCTVMIQFASSSSGTWVQKLVLNYRNLIEADFQEMTLSALSGFPASLIFDPDENVFPFGELIGSQNRAVTERADVITQTRTVTVVNAGELSARNLTPLFSETCFNPDISACPAGITSAYTMNHNCPNRLFQGETCQLTVTFTPNNQDQVPGPTPAGYELIDFEGRLRLDYENDPFATSASLNGRFPTTSTTIEADFETSITEFIFTNEIVSGNRTTKGFIFTNNGFREGEAISIKVYNNGDGSHLATCYQQAAGDFLQCYDPTLTTPTTLAEFPFAFKDSGDCFRTATEDKFYVPIEDGCVIIVQYQPSLTYLSPTISDVRLDIEFDSRFKGNVTLKENVMHTMEATSIPVARMESEKITLGPTDYLPTILSPGVFRYDFGRMALQSPSFYSYRNLTLLFINNGGVAAVNTSFTDGSNNAIPFNSVGTTDLYGPLGGSVPNYYADFSASATNCTSTAVNVICSVSGDFAPIGKPSVTIQDDNMYDDLVPDKIKRIIMTYDNGALYSDSNFYDGAPDILPQTAEIQIEATLINKGFLKDYAIDNAGAQMGPNGLIENEQRDYYFKIQNIGTGPIPYIAWVNWKPANNPHLQVLPVPDPTLYGGTSNCDDIIDFDWLASDTYADLTALPRVNNWGSLAQDEICILGLRIKPSNHNMRVSLPYIGTVKFGALDLTANEFTRDFSLGALDTPNSYYKHEEDGQAGTWMELDYYDGDVTDPGVSGQFAANFGNQITELDGFEYRSPVFSRANLSPWQPYPLSAATIYRPSFTVPDLISDFDASIRIASVVHPEQYFYGAALDNVLSVTSSQFDTEGTVKAFHTRNYSGVNIPALSAGFDYVFYGGTFPANLSDNFSLGLVNSGNADARITSITLVNADPEIAITSGGGTFPGGLPVTSLASHYVTMSANPGGTAGVYTAELHVTYDNGLKADRINAPNEIVTKTILVAFQALPTASTPNVEFRISEASLTLAVGIPPVESWGPANLITSGFNHNAGADTVTWSWVKDPAPAIDAGYASKRVYIENTSLSPLYNLRLFYRSALTSTVLTNLTTVTGLSIDTSDCATELAATRPTVSLAPSSSCYIEIKYQPALTDFAQSTFFSVVYETAENQYVFKQFDMALDPKDPALVEMVGGTQKPIQIPAGVVPSYALDFNTIDYDSEPTVLAFEADSGTYAHIELVNNVADARASFLYSYHEYLVNHGIDPAPPVTRVPAPGEYRIVNGREVAEFYKTTYGPGFTGADKMIVEGTEGCFIGEDPPGAHFEKGFNAGSGPGTCYIHVTFNMEINYIAELLTSVDPDNTMNDHIELKYYNNLRASFSSIYFHFEGRVVPNSSLWVGAGGYSNVAADSSGYTEFEWESFAPSNPALGAIVGYEVVRGISSTAVSDAIFSASTSSSEWGALNTDYDQSTGLDPNTYYYYMVYPIRFNANFTDTTKWGLPSGHWLSPSDATVLRIAIPPIGKIYDHESFSFINMDIEAPAPSELLDARADCLTKVPHSMNDGGAIIPKPYYLITQEIWDVIDSDPSNSAASYGGGSYGAYNTVPHWIDGTTHNLATALFGLTPDWSIVAPSHDYGAVDRVFFATFSGRETEPVYRLGGGVYSASKADYDMYIHPETPFGLTRCWVDLN